MQKLIKKIVPADFYKLLTKYILRKKQNPPIEICVVKTLSHFAEKYPRCMDMI